jgi:hypothetical protein
MLTLLKHVDFAQASLLEQSMFTFLKHAYFAQA